jgi:hypothetical protein
MKYIQITEKEQLEQFIRGSLLGDGWLSPQKTSKTMSYMAFTHSTKQLDYLKWKRNFLESFGILCKMRTYTHKSPRYKSGECISHSFTSRSHPLFSEYRQKYYGENGKGVNREDVEKLDDFGLAIWYMDDGNIWNRKNRSSCITINTQSFTKEDILFLIDLLKRKWEIISTYNKSDNTIRVSSKSCEKLIEIVRPYILECFKYKMVHLKLGELLEPLEADNQQPT